MLTLRTSKHSLQAPLLGLLLMAIPAFARTAEAQAGKPIASNGNATVALGASLDPYLSPDALAITGGQMTIRGLPYGYYDTGTLLSIVATNRDIYSSWAGVNGGYEQGVRAMAGDADMDQVGFYDQVGNTAARCPARRPL